MSGAWADTSPSSVSVLVSGHGCSFSMFVHFVFVKLFNQFGVFILLIFLSTYYGGSFPTLSCTVMFGMNTWLLLRLFLCYVLCSNPMSRPHHPLVTLLLF